LRFETIDQKPKTENRKPKTENRKPETRNQKLETPEVETMSEKGLFPQNVIAMIWDF